MTKRLTIIGAGIPGLALGIDVLQRCGAKDDFDQTPSKVEVEIWDAAPQPAERALGDQRTTAFLPPSQDYLESLGVWQAVEDNAAALDQLRLVDDRGERHSKPLVETFTATDYSPRPFAMNVANAALRTAMTARFQDAGGTIKWNTLYKGEKVEGLLVGADGQISPVRHALGIELDNRKPYQSAIVCTASHSLSQNGVSTEFHRDAGPFTLVPATKGDDGKDRTAIVWVQKPADAAALAGLPNDEFSKRLQINARGLLGEVFETTQPRMIPVATQQSTSLGQPGKLLMAEAAHALPPIGAQGMNLSLADAIALGELLIEFDDWTGPALLCAYEQARKADIGMRLNATDALNRVTTWQSGLRDPLTYGVLGLIKHIPSLRHALVKTGMGI